MFQDDRVSGHQVGGEHPDRLIDRKIPWLNAVDDTDRQVCDDALLLAATVGALLVGKVLRAFLRRVLEDLRAELDFHLAVLQQFACFLCHQIGELVGILPQRLHDVHKVRRALRMCLATPFQKAAWHTSSFLKAVSALINS